MELERWWIIYRWVDACVRCGVVFVEEPKMVLGSCEKVGEARVCRVGEFDIVYDGERAGEGCE
jgi:hypothetical protein